MAPAILGTGAQARAHASAVTRIRPFERVAVGEWLSPGAHVNSVGYNTAGREVDGETVGDGLLDPERVVEIGEAEARALGAGREVEL